MRFQTTIFALVTLAYSSLTGCHKPEPETSDLSIIRSELSILTAPKIVSESTVILDAGFNYCSGTIVAEDKILTAAHCLDFVEDAQSIVVRFGPDLRSVRYGRVALGTPRIHPTLDLAVLQIENLPQGYYPAKIFPPSARLRKYDSVVIAGYGQTGSERDNFAEFLRWGTTKFDQFLSEVEYEDGSVYPSILRFRGRADQAAVCNGDSGGPIFRKIGDHWGLTGVISGGPVACEDFSESLASDPRPNSSWILQPFLNVPKTCDLSPDMWGQPIALKYWDSESETHTIVEDPAAIRFLDIQNPDIDRDIVRFTGYVHADATTCGENRQTCIEKYANVTIRSESSIFNEMNGESVRSSPSNRANVLGIISDTTWVRVIERLPDGWLKIDLEGTIDRNTCRNSPSNSDGAY
ncbi:MAG: trypsin-like serine protease [Pseudobacteriovorax sp.]|nr:trypsin-like serine protease [Pseudobacteriovorax sp.]